MSSRFLGITPGRYVNRNQVQDRLSGDGQCKKYENGTRPGTTNTVFVYAGDYRRIAFYDSTGSIYLHTLDTSSSINKRLGRFEKPVDALRSLLKIPGMSAIIIKDQKVLWAKGFGFADLENRIAATPDTVFHLASITNDIWVVP